MLGVVVKKWIGPQLSHCMKFADKNPLKTQPKKLKKKGKFSVSPNCPADTNLLALNQVIPISEMYLMN